MFLFYASKDLCQCSLYFVLIMKVCLLFLIASRSQVSERRIRFYSLYFWGKITWIFLYEFFLLRIKLCWITVQLSYSCLEIRFTLNCIDFSFAWSWIYVLCVRRKRIWLAVLQEDVLTGKICFLHLQIVHYFLIVVSSVPLSLPPCIVHFEILMNAISD